MAKNQLGYDVLDTSMSKKIMGVDLYEKELTEHEIVEILTNLNRFDIGDPRERDFDPNLTHEPFAVAELQGDNIEDHFENISKRKCSWIKKALLKFAAKGVPERPKTLQGIETEGWYRFDYETNKWCKSPDGIIEEVAVFDTETFVQSSAGNWAIIGTAVTGLTYYVYVHESFLDPSIAHTKKLIHVGALVKILIGHNVCFDYARINDNYQLAPANYVMIDTQSMFNVTHGLTSDLMKGFEVHGYRNLKEFPYAQYGAKANLVDAYNFYHRHSEPMKKEAKEIRDVFVKCETIQEMHDIGGRDNLLLYALDDTYYTYKLFASVLQDYFNHCPMWTAFYAMVILGTPRMPLDNNFWEWFKHCEQIFADKQQFIADTFDELAEELYQNWLLDEVDVDMDPWFSKLDWSMNTSMSKRVVKRYFVYRTDKAQSEVVEVPHGEPVGDTLKAYCESTGGKYELTKSGNIRNKKIGEDITHEPTYPHLYRKPAWYVLAKKSPITTKSQLSHYLLRLKWLNYPVFMTDDNGWCYVDDEKIINKVPHKKGEEANVGCMLTKDFIGYYEKNIMQAESDKAQKLMRAAVSCSYWLSVRSRVESVLTTKVSNPYGDDVIMCGSEVSPHNTISGRGGQRLWYTVPGTEGNEHKIGAEIKTRVCAPDGWSIVGGDIDSEEAAIFAMYADTKYGVSGSSPIGNILITGSKENKDDVHYRLAKVGDIARKPAKTINYGIAYGAGFPTVDKTMAKENPTMPKEKRHALVRKILEIKKGVKCGNRYEGGMDSDGFNYMLDLLDEFMPRTPFLETYMSQALDPMHDEQKRNFTSVQNWTIQRSGADFLACMLVGCNYLSERFNLGALFCISMHDEIFYLVPKQNEMKFAACFLMAHIWTWAMFHYKLGLYDVPLRRLFISGVYVGNRWSKDLSSTKTITNPTNDQEGREINHKQLIPIMEDLFRENS